MAEYKVGYRVKERLEPTRTGIIMRVSPMGSTVFVLWQPASEDSLQLWTGMKYPVAELDRVADVVETQEAPHGFQVGQRLLLYTREVLTVTGIKKRATYYDIKVEGSGTVAHRSFSHHSFGDKTLLSILAVSRYNGR